jgi:hypothetical protein
MLVSVQTEFVAHAIVRALEAVDVPATVFGGNLAGMRAEAPSQAVVMVRRMDLDRARVALESVRTESVDFDPEELAKQAEEAAVEPDPASVCLNCGYDVRHVPDGHVCPECGQSRLRRDAPGLRMTMFGRIVLAMFILLVGYFIVPGLLLFLLFGLPGILSKFN